MVEAKILCFDRGNGTVGFFSKQWRIFIWSIAYDATGRYY